MPVQLFDVRLPLVAEQQLGRYVLFVIWRLVDPAHLVVVGFHSEIPHCDLVIGPRRSEDGIVCGMPFDGCNRSFVPLEEGNGRRIGGLRPAQRQVKANI